MKKKDIPLGARDLEKLKPGNLVYVDKTISHLGRGEEEYRIAAQNRDVVRQLLDV